MSDRIVRNTFRWFLGYTHDLGSKRKLQRVDFVKMHIEGAEIKALLGERERRFGNSGRTSRSVLPILSTATSRVASDRTGQSKMSFAAATR